MRWLTILMLLLLVACGRSDSVPRPVFCESGSPAQRDCWEFLRPASEDARAALRHSCRRDYGKLVSRCERGPRWVGSCEHAGREAPDGPAASRVNHSVHPDAARVYPAFQFQQACQRAGGRWVAAAQGEGAL